MQQIERGFGIEEAVAFIDVADHEYGSEEPEWVVLVRVDLSKDEIHDLIDDPAHFDRLFNDHHFHLIQWADEDEEGDTVLVFWEKTAPEMEKEGIDLEKEPYSEWTRNDASEMEALMPAFELLRGPVDNHYTAVLVYENPRQFYTLLKGFADRLGEENILAKSPLLGIAHMTPFEYQG